jgi:hypothetical protein
MGYPDPFFPRFRGFSLIYLFVVYQLCIHIFTKLSDIFVFFILSLILSVISRYRCHDDHLSRVFTIIEQPFDISSAQTNMSSPDAFRTHTSDNDSASVEEMILPVETNDVITISNDSKMSEDITSLYLNEKFSDVILVLDGKNLHAHKVLFIIYVDLYRNTLFCFKGNSCCEK